MNAVDLADVQGLILRGYKMPLARYVGLNVRDAGAARTFLRAVSDGDPAVPSVTTAQPWTAEKPACALNLGFTAAGLAAIGVAQETSDSFPEEFAAGASARAQRAGDTGSSAPQHWLPWLTEPGPHMLLTVSAQSADALERTTGRLERAWSAGWVELGRLDGEALPGGGVAHFGYRDGLSQPTIEGAPLAGLPDRLPRAPLGEFLLGHPSQHPQYTYPVPVPAQLGTNGSFAAFRVLEQDCNAFAEFLTTQASRTGMSEELVAAKLCGRWRNGIPLVLSPDTDTPDPPIPAEALNDFDYVGDHDDTHGYKCPFGSHIRRMYPRGDRVAGNAGHRHRIVRRGIAYGPPYDPMHPRDGRDRGLLGLFIGVSLKDQFEFLMADWANSGAFSGGLEPTDEDPLIGAGADGAGRFSIPRPEGPVVLDGFSRFVTTRGGAYCFLPSISAIRYLAELPG